MSKLTELLAKQFAEEFEKVLQKEIADPEFLPQKYYADCRSRAKAGIDLACEKVVDTLALSIAVHEEEKHGENTVEEQAALLNAGANPEVMEPEIQKDGTYGLWN